MPLETKLVNRISDSLRGRSHRVIFDIQKQRSFCSVVEFQYATLNRDQLVRQIATDYAEMLEQSARMQRNKFGLQNAIQPNGAWDDAPFNTRQKQLADSYAFIDQASFNEYLKTL